MLTVGDVLSAIDSIAPFSSQEEWDNSGLLVGTSSAPVGSVLFTLDLTQPVIREARARGAALIVTHHPVMLSPRRKMTDEDMEGRLIRQLIQDGISLIAAHTNLDRAPGGINDTLASVCGLSDVSGEGFFRCGKLSREILSGNYADSLENVLLCKTRMMGPGNKTIRRIGLSSGGGGEFWTEAVLSGCDAMITGEMKHHHALAAVDAGLVVFECGHYATEVPGIRALAKTLQISFNKLKYNLGIFISDIPAYYFSEQP